MDQTLEFVRRTLFDLYVITFLLRILMQWAGAGYYSNPLTQFIVRVTNPLVVPFRRIVPPIGNLDTATVVVILLLELVATVVMVGATCAGGSYVLQVTSMTILSTVYLTLNLFFFVLLAYAILSWINPNPYNPIANLLAAISEPVLQPIRRLVPPIGGLDLSVLFALIAIQALNQLLTLPTVARVAGSMGCLSIGQFL